MKIWKMARILCLFLIFFFPYSFTVADGSFPTFSRQFYEIAKKALPAVVCIETKTNVGSGFFICEDGHIVTNSHLLENAGSIEVITYDKQTYDAHIIALDLNTDIAVIKIDGSRFSYLNYGNSDELEVGEFIVSMGYSSCVLGIVKESGIRNIGLFQTEEFIKTNAVIYLGASGGPLLNAKGEVVGINTATLVDSKGKYLEESLVIASKLALPYFCLSQSKTH